MKKIIMLAFAILIFTNKAYSFKEAPISNTNTKPSVIDYSKISKDTNIIEALKIMENSPANLSYKKIMGDNPTKKSFKIKFTDLGTYNAKYKDYDAMGWKKGSRLYIYVNPKHIAAPKEALCGLIASIAIHEDEYDSINEQVEAWMIEAKVWDYFIEQNPNLENYKNDLVIRESVIRKAYIRGDKTDKYVRKIVEKNSGYSHLPQTSPGFGY